MTHLAIDTLTVDYELRGGGRLAALGPVSFEVVGGQFVCIVGPSGCGKSTLIRVVAGLEAPTQGTVRHDGVVVAAPDAPPVPSPRIGLMFQDANLMPWRTVLDNVALPLELAGVDRQTRYATARGLLETLGLAEFVSAYPASLSGGMAQRVALARVLANRPDVLLLDEPFGALDAITREQVSFDLLAVRRRARQTVLMVTHDVAEAVILADRVLVMSQRPGRIAADIAVTLPRPRSPEQAYTPEFVASARAVRAALNDAQRHDG